MDEEKLRKIIREELAKAFPSVAAGWPPPTIPINTAKHCPKCGIKMSGVMGYVCNRDGCPTGFGGGTTWGGGTGI